MEDIYSNMPKRPPSKRRSQVLWGLTIVLLLSALGWLVAWFVYLRYFETTDDAYANGNKVTINSSIPGSVIAFYADNTDYVVEGQLLIQLDPTQYKILYEKELAALSSMVLQVRQLYDAVQVRKSALENSKVAFDRTTFDFQNRLPLIEAKAISNEDFIHAKNDVLMAQLQVKKAEHELQAALNATGNIAFENHPEIEQQKNRVKEAYCNLKHTSIYAPASGYIAQRSINIGERIVPSTPLMAVIPTDPIWVDANFKETQLASMRIGQPATVTFDLYGSHILYPGKVYGISSGSGSIFSLIPPQNATGNWIKIVQRLPVRIALDPAMIKQYPVRLGISATVSVDISNQDLPILTPSQPSKPVCSTQIFDISMDEVNQVMDQICNQEKSK